MKKFMALSLAILLLLSMITVLPISAQYDTVYDQNFTTFSTAAAAIAALKTGWNAGNAGSLTGATDASILWTTTDGFKSSSWSTYSQTSSKTALSGYRLTTKLRTTGPQWAAIAVRESLTNAGLPGYGSGNLLGKSTQGITFTISGTTASTTTTMSVIIRNSTSLDAADTVFTVPFPSSTANYFGIADRTIVITDTPEEITFSADGHLVARVTIDTTSTNADGSYNKGEVFDGSGTSKGTFTSANYAKIPASGMIDIFQRNNIFSLKSLKLEKEFSFATLEAKIAEAEGYSASAYTAESYAVLSEKIAAAEALMLQSPVTMADVDNAILAIDNAIAGLTWSEDYFMIRPENGAKADKIKLGSTVFLDRAYKIASLPSQFINAGYIMSTIAASSYTVTRPGYVYAITPVSTGTNSQANKLLEYGFRKTSIASFNLFGQAETIAVYTKYLNAGTNIVTAAWALTIFSETNLLADIGEFDGPVIPANHEYVNFYNEDFGTALTAPQIVTDWIVPFPSNAYMFAGDSLAKVKWSSDGVTGNGSVLATAKSYQNYKLETNLKVVTYGTSSTLSLRNATSSIDYLRDGDSTSRPGTEGIMLVLGGTSIASDEFAIVFKNGQLEASGLQEKSEYKIKYPTGVSINADTAITVYDLDDKVYIYMGGIPAARIELTGLTGGSYTAGSVYNSKNELVGASFNNMVIKREGNVGYSVRGGDMEINNMTISQVLNQTQTANFDSFDKTAWGTGNSAGNKAKLDFVAGDGYTVTLSVKVDKSLGRSTIALKDKDGVIVDSKNVDCFFVTSSWVDVTFTVPSKGKYTLEITAAGSNYSEIANVEFGEGLGATTAGNSIVFDGATINAGGI